MSIWSLPKWKSFWELMNDVVAQFFAGQSVHVNFCLFAGTPNLVIGWLGRFT